MKDIVTPVPPEEVRQVIKKCLENAALVNYTRISEYAKIEGQYSLRLASKVFLPLNRKTIYWKVFAFSNITLMQG